MRSRLFSGGFIYFLSALLLIAYNFLLFRTPLTNTLGYEFAAANALFLVMLSGIITLTFLKKSLSVKRSLIPKLIILLLLPLLLSVVNSMLTMFCSFTDGLLFYILICFPSVIIGFSSGLFIFSFTKRFRVVIFFIALLLIALIPVLEIYFYPQVYFYSPLIGFFPGNIYDEGLSPDLKLFFHQVIVLVYFSAFPLLYYKKQDWLSRNRKFVLSAFLILPVIFQSVSPALGFSTTHSKLGSVLHKKIETDNCSLFYSGTDDKQAEYVALHQEYYFGELRNRFNIGTSVKIRIYLFDSEIQKQQLFGAGNADVAKPWQYSVFVSRDSWYGTLKHEMAHVFTAEFGWGPFKIAHGFNAASIEGMAESIEGIRYGLDIRDLTAMAYQNGYKVNIVDLFEGFSFFKSNSSLSYSYSGAFYDFLISQYGIEKAKMFYKTGEFKSVYNRSLDDVTRNFENNLKDVQTTGNQNMADYYFGRLSIIQKICPRYISDRLNEAWEYMNSSELGEAELLFREVNSKTINYSAVLGLSEIFVKRNRIAEAIGVIENYLGKFQRTPYYFNLLLRLGDLYSMSGEIISAEEIYEKLIHQKPELKIVSISKLRLKLIEEKLISPYINGNDTVKYKILYELNRSEYDYNSLPVLVNLARSMKTGYREFIRLFDRAFVIDDPSKSYALFNLSLYMLENGDYSNARKMAALALRLKDNNPYLKLLKRNFDKTSWFFYNADKLKSSFILTTSD